MPLAHLTKLRSQIRNKKVILDLQRFKHKELTTEQHKEVCPSPPKGSIWNIFKSNQKVTKTIQVEEPCIYRKYNKAYLELFLGFDFGKIWRFSSKPENGIISVSVLKQDFYTKI